MYSVFLLITHTFIHRFYNYAEKLPNILIEMCKVLISYYSSKVIRAVDLVRLEKPYPAIA